MSKSVKQEKKKWEWSEKKCERKWVCCCWRLLLLLWVWCIGKILIFSDFIIVRMLFIFRKTYNKNTFLLRWFIAFICLNGRYFGDYIHTLMCCRAAMAGWWKKIKIDFYFAIFLTHFSSITHLLWRLSMLLNITTMMTWTKRRR